MRFAQGFRNMSTIKRSRSEVSSKTNEILRSTMQAQTRAMARKNKETASMESVRRLMREDCAKLGINDLDAELPPVVHVSGTKGSFNIFCKRDSLFSTDGDMINRERKYVCFVGVNSKQR